MDVSTPSEAYLVPGLLLYEPKQDLDGGRSGGTTPDKLEMVHLLLTLNGHQRRPPTHLPWLWPDYAAGFHIPSPGYLAKVL